MQTKSASGFYEVMMPAYMIIIASIKDKERFMKDYAAATSKLVDHYGGRYIFRAANATLLEGAFGADASTVISQWPDRAAAEKFWTSEEYLEIKKTRAGIAECQVLLVEAEEIGA